MWPESAGPVVAVAVRDQTSAGSAPRLKRRMLLDAGFLLTVYLVCLFAIRSQFVVGPLGSMGAPALLVGVAGAAWWAFYHLQRPLGTRYGAQPLRVAVLVVMVAFLFSFVAAMHRPISAEESSTAVAGMASLVSLAGITLLVSDGIPSRARFDQLLSRLVLAAMLLAALGVAQFVTNEPLWSAVKIPGLRENLAGGGLALRNGFARPAGTATHPIEFGAVLTTMLPMAITHARFRSRRGDHRWWIGVAVMGLGIVIAISRSALLCAVVGLAILAMGWGRRERRALLVGVFTLVAMVSLAIPGMMGSLRGLFLGAAEDNSVSSRTGSYRIAWEFFVRSPVFGRGYSTFLPRYRIFDNEYLLLLVEVGALGVIAVLGLLLAGMWSARRARVLSTDPKTAETGQALMAGIAAGALGLALFDGLAFPLSTGVLFLLLGFAGALRRLNDESETASAAATSSS